MAKFETINIEGFEAAIYGMRNPLKSHSKMDSYGTKTENFDAVGPNAFHYVIGKNDYDLMKHLGKAGNEHRKYLRMIQVGVNISAPRYFGTEGDTYKIGTVTNSESTMHTIFMEDLDEKNFEGPCFSGADGDIEAAFRDYLDLLKTIKMRCKQDNQNKSYYLILLKAMLPESFIQKRTVNLNYETLATMYHQRKYHRLPQGSETFCNGVKTLPYSEFITGEFDE